MSTTLITSRDPKGLQAVRMFEAAYDKAKLDDQRAQRLNENPELASRFKQLINELSEQWFDLEVDNTMDPMKVLTMAGIDSHIAKRDWKFLGPKFEGRKTYRVKLMDLGSVANLEVAREDAKSKGYRLLEGQGREPFRRKLGYFDRHIVFGGNEWENSFGRQVTCLRTSDSNCWWSHFKYSNGGDRHQEFDNNCLWAVVGQGA